MKSQNGIRDFLKHYPVVPVVTIEHLEEVIPLINFFNHIGIHCIEITLRSNCALEAIKLAKKYVPSHFKIGVGTVIKREQLLAVIDAEVDFIVLPGLNSELVKFLQQIQIPFLPGAITPSEIMCAQELGWDTLKFFPANISGGLKAITTFGQVFPGVSFCPTGGITKENHTDYLALENVISVGGSWVQKDFRI
jgi:2-dehydro-3-deoxyphosphogluconate aldolase/(4S)-4-hydroxy-2-oxoglutarate aldolase